MLTIDEGPWLLARKLGWFRPRFNRDGAPRAIEPPGGVDAPTASALGLLPTAGHADSRTEKQYPEDQRVIPRDPRGKSNNLIGSAVIGAAMPQRRDETDAVFSADRPQVEFGMERPLEKGQARAGESPQVTTYGRSDHLKVPLNLAANQATSTEDRRNVPQDVRNVSCGGRRRSAMAIEDDEDMQTARGPWLGCRAAARYLSCCTRTLYRKVQSGSLKAARMGRTLRFRRQDLDAFLMAQASAGRTGPDLDSFINQQIARRSR